MRLCGSVLRVHPKVVADEVLRDRGPHGDPDANLSAESDRCSNRFDGGRDGGGVRSKDGQAPDGMGAVTESTVGDVGVGLGSDHVGGSGPAAADREAEVPGADAGGQRGSPSFPRF